MTGHLQTRVGGMGSILLGVWVGFHSLRLPLLDSHPSSFSWTPAMLVLDFPCRNLPLLSDTDNSERFIQVTIHVITTRWTISLGLRLLGILGVTCPRYISSQSSHYLPCDLFSCKAYAVYSRTELI